MGTSISADGRMAHNPGYIRVLQWTFQRDGERVFCELGLTGDDMGYQLRVEPPWNPTGVTIELFSDAMPAFQRHAMLERVLIDGGWALESFESKKVERV